MNAIEFKIKVTTKHGYVVYDTSSQAEAAFEDIKAALSYIEEHIELR